MADETPSAAHDERPFAVLDVGSNSARMIVFRLRDGEHLDVIEDARAPLRLARELHTGAELGPEAIERTLEALRDFRAVAEGAGADRILAVATSAVRDALDGHLLLERARELGVPLEIIDGDTEAHLGFVGAVHDLPVTSGATLDVGGGSAEISRFRDRRLNRSWMFELGSLRVSDRFLEDDPPSASQLKRMRKHVSETLRAADIDDLASGEVLVGIGGTVRNLAKVDMHRTEHPLGLLHGYELPADRLEAILDDLAGKSMKRRAQVAGLNPDRADSVIGGAVVLAGGHVRARRRSDRRVQPRGARGTRARRTRRDAPASAVGAHDLDRHTLRAVRQLGRASGGAPHDDRHPVARHARPGGARRGPRDAGPRVDRRRRGASDRLLRPLRARGDDRHVGGPGRVHPRAPRHPVGDPATGRRRHPARPVSAADRGGGPFRRCSAPRRSWRSPTS